MAQLVDRRVEGRRPATPATPGPPVGRLVILLWDGGPDATATQQRPVGPGAVGLVSQHPVRSRAGTSRTQPRHPDPAQHRPELGAVAALAGGDHDRQGALATLDRQVQLAAQPASGAPKGVIGGLVVDSARFFALPVPPLRAPAAC
jgi:hypothetical protein